MPAMIDSMFYVGETPWHRQGKKLDNPPTVEEAIKEAGLDWYVKKMPTYVSDLDNDEEYYGGRATIPTGHFYTMRIDKVKQHWEENAGRFKELANDKELRKLYEKSNHHGIKRKFTPLGPVSERYGILQNKDAFEPFNVLLDYGYTLEAAGAIDEGRKVWILAKAPEHSMVGDDKLDKYVMLFTSHDGSAGSQFRPTAIRAICQNTIDLALKGTEKFYSLKHTSNITARVKELTKNLDIMKGNVRNAINDMNRMTEYKIGPTELDIYLELSVPYLKTRHKESIPERNIFVRNNAKPVYEKMVDNFKNGRGNKGETLWDAYNAITEYYTHDANYKDWVKSTQFGKPYDYKVNALRVAQHMVRQANTTLITA